MKGAREAEVFYLTCDSRYTRARCSTLLVRVDDVFITRRKTLFTLAILQRLKEKVNSRSIVKIDLRIF
jgi:hypothetical protein